MLLAAQKRMTAGRGSDWGVEPEGSKSLRVSQNHRRVLCPAQECCQSLEMKKRVQISQLAIVVLGLVPTLRSDGDKKGKRKAGNNFFSTWPWWDGEGIYKTQ
jgi:hypothetical protein